MTLNGLKLPLVVMIGLAAQTGGIIYWLSDWKATTETRLTAVETTVNARTAFTERFLAMEPEVKALRVQVDRVETKLDRLIDLRLQPRP